MREHDWRRIQQAIFNKNIAEQGVLQACLEQIGVAMQLLPPASTCWHRRSCSLP